MLFFVQLLSGNSVINCGGAVAFTFMHTFVKILSSSLIVAMLTGNVTCNLQNSRYFRCPVWKLMKLIKSELTQKLKHINSILEYFEYYCQISSKLIHTISSYTVSKLGRFLETQCSIFCYRSMALAVHSQSSTARLVLDRMGDRRSVCG